MAEEESARRSKAIQALILSNSALRCILTKKYGRSAREPSEGEPLLELSKRHEQMIEAVKLLQEDLRFERKKSELRCCRQFYSDIARLVLFIVGSLVALAIFHPAFFCAARLYSVFSSK